MKERKETLSPTFLQTIASYKSPLTAFGEGLMKVGETNQKIHDTIWEHDLRQERLERERALHNMQVEAHELKMRRENFEQEQNEKYSSAEREAGIAKTRAGTWNTWENTRATKERTNDFLNKNMQEESDATNISNSFYDEAGIISINGQAYRNSLLQKTYDTSLPIEQRRAIMKELVTFDINRGRRLGNPALQKNAQVQWTDEYLDVLDFYGISPQYFKNQNGKIVGINTPANNILGLLEFGKDNLAVLKALKSGQVFFKDLDEGFKESFKAYGQTYRDTLPKVYQDKRAEMEQLAGFLEKALIDPKSIENSIGLTNNFFYELKSFLGGTTKSENAFRMLHSIGTASAVKEYYGGHASDPDRKSIEKPIGTVWQDNKKVIDNVIQLINNKINVVSQEIDGANPIVAWAKYGNSYERLKFMRDCFTDIINHNAHGKVIASSDGDENL